MIYFLNDRGAPPLEQQPRVGLTSWRLFELEDGTRRVLACLPSGVARITTTIAHIDSRARTAVTFSGRSYDFLCAPEGDPTICNVLVLNALRVGLGPATDISDSIWAHFLSYEQ